MDEARQAQRLQGNPGQQGGAMPVWAILPFCFPCLIQCRPHIITPFADAPPGMNFK
ncbi:hypothetical protein RvVAR031_29190 [Agrobacterium vitis]|nr:hypothetical protein RvVAR031_29190 [Agrobacterium vitis]